MLSLPKALHRPDSNAYKANDAFVSKTMGLAICCLTPFPQSHSFDAPRTDADALLAILYHAPTYYKLRSLAC
eukprot:scaffold39748_cov45-Prasinocladus_malaysianus.AAC.1